MILYHGSYTDFAQIDLSLSQKGKDFGKGFYLSDNYDQAYDVVYGPIANDKVGVQIRNLIEQNIDMDIFLKRLKYMQRNNISVFFWH